MPASHDDIRTLLPTYLARTLDRDDAEAVERHLGECEGCRREIEGLRRVQTALRTVVESRPAPSPDLFARVSARVQASEHRGAGVERRGIHTWGASVVEWAAWLMTPRLAPALALGVIVLQLGALAVLGTRLYDSRHGAGFTTQSGGAPAPGTPGGVTYRVAFQDTATERDIRTALQGLGARIVEGPTTAGFYLVTLPAGSARSLGDNRVVRFAEPVR